MSIRSLNRGFLFLILSTFVVSLSAIAQTSANTPTITRVHPGWREAASFKRISEYFTGRENTGGEIIIRSHPEQRAGFYFLIRTANVPAPLKAQIVIHLIMPIGKQARTHTFPVELPPKQSVLNLGITGPDWIDPKTNPVAWKVDILGPDGQLLTSEKSYLWDKPVGVE